MTITPFPEMLQRQDVAHGEWTIDDCGAVRGTPHTNIIDRKMVVPHSDDEIARVIRAHEMAHAKLSPADDYEKWVERGVASNTAMKAVEEVRVNYLIGKAGFNTKALVDGTELPAGEQVAKLGDWAGAVYTTVAFTSTGGLNQFITGVRRHNKEWAETLREISRKVLKEIEKAGKSNLTSTERCDVTGLSPKGFRHVERIAQWVDQLAYPPKDELEEDKGESDDSGDKVDTSKAGKAPVSTETVKRSAPAKATGDRDEWAEMSIIKCVMPRRTRGGMGKKRRASNVGTNPRRVSRLLTDPERKVFDSHKRGMGGVVLIDGSGSMHLSTAQIMQITEASAGCVVAVYSTFACKKDGGRLFIVAENGKMVESLDDYERGAGNGCDAPALRWAIKQARRGEPIVWVCDGMVTGWTDDEHEKLTLECLNLVRRNKVWMARDVEGAVKVLNTLKRGAKPHRWIPSRMLRVETSITGAGR